MNSRRSGWKLTLPPPHGQRPAMAVVAAVGEPARHHRIGQPCPPATLDTHPCVDLSHAEQDAADRQWKKHRGQMKHGRGIAFLDGVEDRPIPDIDAVLETDIGDDQDHKADGKHPRQPVAASAPKSLGADPESRQQIILAGLLGFFRRQFWVGFEEFGRRRLDLVAGFGDDFDERGFFRGTLRLRGRFRHAR